MMLPGSKADGIVSCSKTRTRRTTSSSISNRRIRPRPTKSRPIDRAPRARAPTATAPIAIEANATVPTACAPVAAAGIFRVHADFELINFIATPGGSVELGGGKQASALWPGAGILPSGGRTYERDIRCEQEPMSEGTG